jgi:hypothetical protein
LSAKAEVALAKCGYGAAKAKGGSFEVEDPWTLAKTMGTWGCQPGWLINRSTPNYGCFPMGTS